MEKVSQLTFFPGSPQFRIKSEMNSSAPRYIFYSQTDLENDLVGFVSNSVEKKEVRTFDAVSTVETGDVLFSLISGKATVVQAVHQGYLFTQNYVKITPNKQIDTKYLVYLLNEDFTINRQFQTSLQGSQVLKFTVKQLKELKLPQLPPLKKQIVLGSLYFNQMKRQALKEKVAEIETKIIFEKMKEVK